MKNDIEIPLINRVLPKEMLEMIFSHLAPKDLKTVMLICKTWNAAADTPALWTWVKIRFRSQLQLKRLHGAREMAVGGMEVWPLVPHPWENGMVRSISWVGLMQNILQHPGLKKIIVTEEINTRPLYFNFSDAANVDLLTQVFCKHGGG